MSGTDFFKTIMGRQFYDGHVPSLVNSLEKLAKHTEIIAAHIATPVTGIVRHSLSAEDLKGRRNAEGVLKAVVPVEFAELLGLNIDGLNDMVEEAIAGTNGLLSDIRYRLVGVEAGPGDFVGGTALVEVTARYEPIETE